MENSGATLTPAYLLHRRPYGNHGVLVECFTPEAGRFPAVARGVTGRKSRGGAAALLQPFVPLMIGWDGRGEVKNLRRYEAAAPAPSLTGRALYCGFYLNELLLRLTRRGDPSATLFGHYTAALASLSDPSRLEPALRRFELRLLDALGVGLILDREADTGAPIDPEHRYHYRLERGPTRASPGEPEGIAGATLLALHQDVPLDATGLAEARRLNRRILAHYLGDRPLKSRELFDNLPSAEEDDR